MNSLFNEYFPKNEKTGQFYRIEVGGEILPLRKTALEERGKGGILDLVISQKKPRGGVSIDGSSQDDIKIHGGDIVREQLKTYIAYIENNIFFSERMTLEQLATKVIHLVTCGVDLEEALDYFNVKENCSDVVGTLLCIMGDSFVNVIMDADEHDKWKKLFSNGLDWAYSNRPKELIKNADVLASLFLKYSDFEKD